MNQILAEKIAEFKWDSTEITHFDDLSDFNKICFIIDKLTTTDNALPEYQLLLKFLLTYYRIYGCRLIKLSIKYENDCDLSANFANQYLQKLFNSTYDTLQFNFHKDMFDKFVELKGSPKLLIKLAKMMPNIDNKYFTTNDVLYYAICEKSIPFEYIRELYSMNKFTPYNMNPCRYSLTDTNHTTSKFASIIYLRHTEIKQFDRFCDIIYKKIETNTFNDVPSIDALYLLYFYAVKSLEINDSFRSVQFMMCLTHLLKYRREIYWIENIIILLIKNDVKISSDDITHLVYINIFDLYCEKYGLDKNKKYAYIDSILVNHDIFMTLVEYKKYALCQSILNFCPIACRYDRPIKQIYKNYQECIDEKEEWRDVMILYIGNFEQFSDEENTIISNMEIDANCVMFSREWYNNCDPNQSINGKTTFEYAMEKGGYYFAKKIIKHPKFKPNKSKSNLIDIVLELDCELKQKLLILLLQKHAICTAEQVKKLTELGIDVYKLLQSGVSNLSEQLDDVTNMVTFLVMKILMNNFLKT